MLIKFILVNLIALYINNNSLDYFIQIRNIRAEIAQVYSISFSLTANFLGNKFWTFRSVSKS
jgi:putative flippase GtrA